MDDYLVKETIEAMKIHRSEYLDTIWKTLGALMVAIGWIISSDKALALFNTNQNVRIGASIIIFLMAISHFSSLFDSYKKSKRTKDSLGKDIDALLLSLTDSYVIPKYYPFAGSFINGLLYLTLIGLINSGCWH